MKISLYCLKYENLTEQSLLCENLNEQSLIYENLNEQSLIKITNHFI